jgi:hypothetical protein
LLKWNKREDGSRYCYSIAYWKYTNEGYELRAVGEWDVNMSAVLKGNIIRVNSIIVKNITKEFGKHYE